MVTILRFIRQRSQLILAIVGAVTILSVIGYGVWLVLTFITTQTWFRFDIILSIVVACAAVWLGSLLSERNRILRVQTMLMRDVITIVSQPDEDDVSDTSTVTAQVEKISNKSSATNTQIQVGKKTARPKRTRAK